MNSKGIIIKHCARPHGATWFCTKAVVFEKTLLCYTHGPPTELDEEYLADTANIKITQKLTVAQWLGQ